MLSPTNKVDEKKYFLTANVPMIITPEQEIVNKDVEINGEEKTITYLKDKQVILHFEYNYKHFNIYNKDIILNNNYTISLIFLLLNLTLFYFFAKSKNTVSRKESLILLSTYVLFLLTQIFFINILS